MTEIAGRVEFLHEFVVDDVVREGSRRFDALEPPELGLHTSGWFDRTETTIFCACEG